MAIFWLGIHCDVWHTAEQVSAHLDTSNEFSYSSKSIRLSIVSLTITNAAKSKFLSLSHFDNNRCKYFVQVTAFGAMCVPCTSGCASCDSGDHCVDCVDGQVISALTSRCVDGCEDGFYNQKGRHRFLSLVGMTNQILSFISRTLRSMPVIVRHVRGTSK